jgi:hypothetical protein
MNLTFTVAGVIPALDAALVAARMSSLQIVGRTASAPVEQ